MTEVAGNKACHFLFFIVRFLSHQWVKHQIYAILLNILTISFYTQVVMNIPLDAV